MEKYTRDDAIALLRAKYNELCEALDENSLRYPKKDDFTEDEVAVIKSFLGPWPRALEAAQIKPAREGESDKKEKNREKRARAKRRRRENGEVK